jgi:outer membrane protein OmpA-like peptidoglycan-associated protein
MLSERRATSVAAYLMNQGLDPNKLTSEGKGESEPIADNATDEGRAKNRRVELHINR